MNQATEALGAIKDLRVLPWLIRMFQMHNFDRKRKAMEILTPFKSSVAFDTLKAGLAIHGADLDDCSTPAETASAVSSLHADAAYALAKSPCPEALPVVKSFLHDPDDEVRQSIEYALEENKTGARPLLRVLAHDPDREIRVRATYELKLDELESKAP